MFSFRYRHRKAVRIVGAVLAGLLLLAALGGSALYASVTAGLPDVTRLDRYDPAETTKIFASDGTLVATLFDENRTYAKYEDIAPVMVTALVAIEDRRFFEHQGVDLQGVARAVLGNANAGGVEQGASTLTMQLARRLFLSEERTYTRKLREAILAHRIDRKLSKEKILELYLNEVYYGAGAYGIDSASAVYFGVNPNKLQLWQAALLAGLVQAPTAYSPLGDKEAALGRLDEVLLAMEQEGKITRSQAQEAGRKAKAYRFVDRPLPSADGMLKYPYFTTYVIRQLAEQFPDSYVRRAGLQVYTSLQIPVQKAAEAALKEGLEGPGRAAGADAGAIVVISNETGNLVAMVGGPGWNAKRQYNAAWQARRQPGSSFKMFIYAAALEAGYTPENEFADTEAVFSPGQPNEWKPGNSDGRFMGPIPLRTGLQFSRNLVAAKLLAHLGPARVISLAHRMGIEGELPAVASLALGAGEVTPLQMARAFSALPSGGVLRPAGVLTKVTTARGEILASFSPDSQGERVLSKDTARHMCEMLHRVVTGGTAPAADIAGTYVAGKTGTTDNFKDAWFAGFTPHHTVSVWVGRDDNRPMGRVYGGDLPAQLFHRVAQAAMRDKDPAAALPGVQFTQGVSAKLCWDSTYLAAPGCPKSYSERFHSDTMPTRVCPLHRQVKLPASALLSGQRQSEWGGAGLGGQIVLRESALPARYNPRKDSEVVTPSGSLIPYNETAPTLAGVKFVIDATSAGDATPTAGATPGLPEDSTETVDEVLGVEGTEVLESGAPTADEDPAFRVPTAAPSHQAAPTPTVPASGRAPLVAEPDYPTSAGGVDVSTTDQVIYEGSETVPGGESATIPADPTERP